MQDTHSVILLVSMYTALIPSSVSWASSDQEPSVWSWHLVLCAQMLSRVQLSVTPWTVTYQVPLSMEFFRQGNNTGMCCHFLLQGIFLTKGKNSSLLRLLHWQVDSLPLCHLGSSLHIYINYIKSNICCLFPCNATFSYKHGPK